MYYYISKCTECTLEKMYKNIECTSLGNIENTVNKELYNNVYRQKPMRRNMYKSQHDILYIAGHCIIHRKWEKCKERER